MFYDSLVGSNNDGTLSTEKGIAYKWEMSPDGLTWTFYLREGIKFHDGVELTSKDVKFTIEQVMRPDSRTTKAESVRATVAKVGFSDPYTVVIDCKVPTLYLAHMFSDVASMEGLIMPKDYTERVGDQGFASHPIGSGPYKFIDQAVGSYIKLEATDKHWRDGVPKYKYLTFLITPEESTRIAMLKTGEADIIDIGREAIKEVKDAGFNVSMKPGAGTLGIYPHGQWADVPLSDIRVRKALNLAINREELLQYLFAGQAKLGPTWPWAAEPLLGIGGDPTLKPYPYDPEEAKRLLKEAGYEGMELNIASFPRAGVPELSQTWEAIAGYWENIGVKPKIHMTEYPAWRLRRQAQDQLGWVSAADIGSRFDHQSALSLIRTQVHSTSDITQCKDPELDSLINRAESTMDIVEAEKLIGDIQRHIYDNYLMWGLIDLGYQVGTNTDILPWDMSMRPYDKNLYELIRQK
ncbi:ABC transporter substrate-binding protein [Chloroflexota bacterium]